MRCRRLLASLLLVATAVPAQAWGPLGHRMVAGMAQERVSEPVRREIRALLQPDDESTLVDAATWADDLRDTDPARFRSSNRWHYVNFSTAQCRYEPRDCRDGGCVVAAIERYEAVLADRTRPRAERADALRFIVHFVADVHQPLHASFRPAKGGNGIQLRYGRENWNLHAVWDSLLLNSTRRRWPDQAAQLLPGIDTAAAAGRPAQWAEESCRIALADGAPPEDGRIDDAWLARKRPIAQRRLQQAAARLVNVLERALAPTRR